MLARSPKPTSQGFPRWARSHQCQHPCVKNTPVFDWANFASGSYSSECASTSKSAWLTQAVVWPCLKILPNFSLRDLQHYTIEQALLSLTTFAFSSNASVDALSQKFARCCPPALDKLPSTVDARAEKCPSANQPGRLQQTIYMKYLGLNFPKSAAFLSAFCIHFTLPPFDSCEEIGISFIVPMRMTRCG